MSVDFFFFLYSMKTALLFLSLSYNYFPRGYLYFSFMNTFIILSIIIHHNLFQFCHKWFNDFQDVLYTTISYISYNPSLICSKALTILLLGHHNTQHCPHTDVHDLEAHQQYNTSSKYHSAHRLFRSLPPLTINVEVSIVNSHSICK